MSVATHLGIRVDEYDARIRTFIPDYEDMLDAAAAALPQSTRRLVDLGTGTGALAARCLTYAPRARLVGIDADPAVLRVAADRLGARATFVTGSFLRVLLPPCDAATASFALHHVRTRRAKARLYRTIRTSLESGGIMISVDCHPARDRRTADRQHHAWHQHLERTYSPGDATRFLRIWAKEDTYVPLADELELMRHARFKPEVLWRKGAFAVLVGLPV